MAVEQFNADIDLLGHIIRNVKIHPMTNAERVSLESSLGSNDVGRTVFDKDEQLLYVWTGTDFVVGNLVADWNNIMNKPATFPASLHTHTESEITDLDKYTQQEVDDKLILKIDSSEKGSPAGVATLGVDGKVPSSQLPDSFSGDMTYKGAWNASTNTPAIANGSGENGDYYRVSVAGSTVIDGNSDWQVGDSLIFNATTGKWEKIDGSAPVNSVFGRTGIIQQENGDYNSNQITNSSLVEGDNVSEALNELHINKAETLHTHEISDVNGLQVELNKKLNNLVSYGGGVEVVKPKLIPDVTTQGARTLAGVNGITLNLVGDLIQIVGQGSAMGLINSDHGSILNVNGNTGQDISPSSNIKVTQFDTVGNSQQGIVPNSSLSRLTIGTTGVYLIGMSGSVMSSGTTKATIKLYVNSVEVPNFSTEIDIDTVNKRKAYAITLPLSLTVGDVLEMFVSHDSLDSRTLTFKKNTLFASKQDVQSGSAVWGNISGSISNQADLQSALSGKANTNHTHTESQITNLDKYSRSEIDGFLLGKSNVGHTHNDTAINNTSSVAGATVRDALNTIHANLGFSWGEITGDITAQTDLQTALNTKLTNAMNLGGETPLIKGKNGLNLEVRTVKGVGGISVSLNGDVVEIAGGSWGSITGNLADQTDLQAALNSKIPSGEKGVANGVATLDGSGKVPVSQLPSYVSDVIVIGDYSLLPVIGEESKIYVTEDENKTYRWTGSTYVEIGDGGVALGETSATAYRGDRGKTAYDHSQTSGNPHNTSFLEITGDPMDNTALAAVLNTKLETIRPSDLAVSDNGINYFIPSVYNGQWSSPGLKVHQGVATPNSMVRRTSSGEIVTATATSGNNAVNLSQMNTALGGKADLVDGKVPVSQLPSYVSDVITVADYESLPATGEESKIYVTEDENKTYRWTGSAYVEIGDGGVALGTTSATAHRGDLGTTAYNHSQSTGNPHETRIDDIEGLREALLNVAELLALEETEYSGFEISGFPAVLLNNKAALVEGVYVKQIGEIFPSEYTYDDSNKAIVMNSADSLEVGDNILVKYYKKKESVISSFSPYDLEPNLFFKEKRLFDGSTYEDIGNLNYIWNSGQYEVWLIIKPDLDYKSNVNVFIGVNEDANGQYWQNAIQTNGSIRSNIYPGGTNNTQYETPVIFSDTEPHVIRITARGNSNREIYADTVLQSLTLIAQQPHNDITTHNTYLGARNVNGVAQNYYSGLISHLFIIDRNLTTSEEADMNNYYMNIVSDEASVIDVFFSAGQSNEASRATALPVDANNNIMIWSEPDQEWQAYNPNAKNNLITEEQIRASATDWIAEFGRLYFEEHEKPAYFIKYALGGTGLYIDSSTPDWSTASTGELKDSYLDNISTALDKIGGIQVFISAMGSDSTGDGTAANPYLTEGKAREIAVDSRYSIIRMGFHSFHQGERDAQNTIWSAAWKSNYDDFRDAIRSHYKAPCIVNTIHPDIPVGTYPYASQVIINQKDSGRFLHTGGTMEDQANGADNNTIVNDLGDLALLPDSLHLTRDSQLIKGGRMYHIWNLI